MTRLRVPVEEFTTPNPVTANDGDYLEDLQHLMQQNTIRHLPILHDGQVVGIVSDRDLRVASGLTFHEREQVRAADIMTPNPITVSAGDSLERVAFVMSEHKVGSVLVNDESESLFGIFTVTDALNALIEIIRESHGDAD